MKNIVVDTNVLYNGSHLRAAKDAGGIRFWGSVANVIELVSDIEDDETFRKTQSRLRVLNEICEPELLPNLDNLILKEIGLSPDTADAGGWRSEVVAAVLGAETRSDVSLNLGLARKRRDEHSTAFRASSNEVISNALPRANTSDEHWNVKAKPDEWSRIEKEILSLEHTIQLLLIFRIGPLLQPCDCEKVNREQLMRVARTYWFAWQGWLIKTIRDGRKPQANDAIDLHFVLPLWREDWFLLTEDRGLLEILALGGCPPGKLLRISDL